MKAKFPEEDGNSVQEAAAGARLTSVTEPAEGSGLTWRPEAECNAQVAVQAINSHNALPVAGSDGLRLSHLQSIIRTQFGQYDFGAGIGVFWCGGLWMSLTLSRRRFGSSFFSQTALGMAWRHLLAAGTV